MVSSDVYLDATATIQASFSGSAPNLSKHPIYVKVLLSGIMKCLSTQVKDQEKNID
jgi:hypothetical protein